MAQKMKLNPNFDRTVFRSERYQSTRGAPLSEMHEREFGTSPVDDLLGEIILKNPNNPPEVYNLSFGDPSIYPGMGPYEGVHRFMRRRLNFNDNPLACARYAFYGDPVFVAQMRQASADIEKGDLKVPTHVAVYPGAGVAGCLRMIMPAVLLPPGEDGTRDNVILPKWTYLSHSAEVTMALANVKTCQLMQDGQVDLAHMEQQIDRNTQMVLFATVGNPLAIAMKPQLFDDLLLLVTKKMDEFNHPIVVVADTIYEHFRRCKDEHIDAIQRVMRLGLEVPVIDTTSFSKMFGIPGYRLAYYRAYWKPDGKFQDERYDFFKALSIVYGTTLCTVPSIVQMGVGELFTAIRSGQPVEEELAPVAATLLSIKDLHEKHGGGDTHTMIPEMVIEEVIFRLGMDPKIWFTTSAIAKRARKLFNQELGKYNKDIFTSVVENIGERLIHAGLIEKRELIVTQKMMLDLLNASIIKHGQIEHIWEMAFNEEREVDPSLHITQAQQKNLYWRFVKNVDQAARLSTEEALHDINLCKSILSVADTKSGVHSDHINLVFYRLINPEKVPKPPRIKDGKILLEGISKNDYGWSDIARDCGVPFERDLYRAHKLSKRSNFEERTDFFLRGLDAMKRNGLGVYLHPCYYDQNGDLVPERVNTFYILFGFNKLMGSKYQAAEMLSLCVELGLPLLKCTPGEVFQSHQDRNFDDSYIRIVTLDSLEKIEQILDIIHQVATYLRGRDDIPK